MNKGSRQAGGVLFLILIAVALFAALSYAVTLSGRGSGGMNREAGILFAARMLDFSSLVHSAVHRLMLGSSVPITELNFNNDAYASLGGTPSPGAMGNPADPSLHVFHPQGGNVTPAYFTDAPLQDCPSCTNNTLSPGHYSVLWLNIPGVGGAGAELVLLGSRPSDELCRTINRMSGVSPTLPSVNRYSSGFVSGDSAPSVQAMDGGDVAGITGKTTFCFQEKNGVGRNLFVHVLQSY